MEPSAAFELKAVVHLIRPWGAPARRLDELRDGIASGPVEVLFNHTVQYQLRHPGADELPPDDLSAWIAGVLQDRETAERLSYAVQTRSASASSVRAGLLEVLDALPPHRQASRDAPDEGAFLFLSATSVVVSTGIAVRDGHELAEALAGTDSSVWFYHLVQEPWFLEGRTPLLDWLATVGEHRLAERLRDAAGAGLPIERARARLLRYWRRSRIARHVADATASPEDVRREAGRHVIARFVRRVTRSDPSS